MKRIKWKRCAALCALLGLCMALAACGASQSTAAGTGTAAAQEDSAQASTLEAGGTTALQLPQDGRKLIMNAELTVEALDFDATLTALREAAEQADGYVSSTYLEGEADSGSRYAHYEFRIPAEQYSTFLAAADGAGFSVSIIPHTGAQTILLEKKPGDPVNLETDVIGKYVEKFLCASKEAPTSRGVTLEFLAQNGF